MESLVATGTSELSHQLAERMALLLSADPTEREQIYRDVKRAYGYRSKVVHGDVMKPSKESELAASAKTCDELVRRALWLALSIR